MKVITLTKNDSRVSVLKDERVAPFFIRNMEALGWRLEHEEDFDFTPPGSPGLPQPAETPSGAS